MSSASTVLDPLRAGPSSSTSLVQALRVPQPRLARALTALQREGRVLKMGATRSTRYALPRSIADAGSSWPVFQVDTTGKSRELGRLFALMPGHFHFETACLPLRGWCAGVPWFLRDLAPDEARLAWCTRHGWDGPGDLLVGVDALELSRHPPRLAITAAQRAVEYPRLAELALAARGSGQLGGAQPKFTALVDHGGHLAQAVVKFSPSLDTPVGQRWADLLIAGHLALAHLNARGIGAAHSRVFRFDGRIFLEVDRFDRVGAHGRRGVVSLRALAPTPAAAAESWSTAAGRLLSARALPKNDARQIRLIEAFARQIAHSGRHAGDLALFDRHDSSFALAPVFDMLPTLFAPREGTVSQAHFAVPEPAPELLDVWAHARRLAEGYWELLVAEPQLSDGFRELCAVTLAALQAAPQRA